VPVITQFPFRRRAASGLQPRHADTRTDQPSGICVGHERIRKHVEHLVQETAAVDLRTCSLHDALRQLVPRAGVGAGQRLIQQLDQFVEDLHVSLGQRRQQDRITAVDIGTLQRLVGGAAAGLGQHPPSTGRADRSNRSAP
jgi:hypothetical protein